MYYFINILLKSKYFNKFNSFFARKIFKIFKIFFVETKSSCLPNENYQIDKNKILKEFHAGKIFQHKDNKPYITYPRLLYLINKMDKKSFNFLDYGAGNLNLFFYLKKEIKEINYFYYDLPELMDLLDEYIKSEKLRNIKVQRNFNEFEIDLVYFGSSLQYLKSYKKIILQLKNNLKYLLVSQTPFFKNKKKNNEFIILKQVNMHPNINYLYAFNYHFFIDFMEKNNFILVDNNFNRVTKFLNFKNFKDEYKDIDMYDLLFKKKYE